MHTYKSQLPIRLESGRVLEEITIAYKTIGQLNSSKTNVIWVTHALTGSPDVDEWWSNLVGPGKTLDTNQYYVVCANVLGSCYGSTGPNSIDPITGTPYFHFFPEVTVRDMVKSLDLLRNELGIQQVELLIGGSLGGQQALEWAILQPKRIKNLCVIASNAQHSAWGIAFNATQRMAIENDPTWGLPIEESGANGLETARAIAMLSYRHYNTYQKTQSEPNRESLNKQHKADSYQRYQGKKLRKRFNAISYWILSKAMDSHDVGRKRGGLEHALAKISAKSLCIGISSDILFPPEEQKTIAKNVNQAKYVEITSVYGHDGFLVEVEAIASELESFFKLNKKLQIH